MNLLKRDQFPLPDIWYRHRVSYGETDAARVVYYAEYLHLFERARSKYMRDAGLSYAEVERRGIVMPVRKASLRYVKPARYDEEIFVRAAVSGMTRTTLTFVYQVFGPPEDTTLLAVGDTELAATENGRPVRIPAWLAERLPRP